MKPNTPQSILRNSRLRTVAVVVVTAVAALGLPARAWALEPAPSPVPAASASPAETGTAPGAIDMKALNAAIGANGAYMGQGLKTQLAGSPRSAASSAVAESLQIESTWRPPGIQGLDVSGYQPTVNWPAQYSMGARFAYVKASEGLTYRSPVFASQYSGALNAGLIRGAYHFALPSISTGAAQADYFVNSGGGWSSDGKTLPPLLDIEYNPYSTLGNTCYNMSAAAMVGWLKDFSNRVLSRTGRLPMIYTTADWWSRCTGNSGAFGNQPLHLARYSTYVGNVPNGWGTYSVWQYSSTGPFAGDSNAWNGTYANLQKFASTADRAVLKPSIMSTGDVVAADASGALWDYPASGAGTFGARKQIGQGWRGLRSMNVIDWNADGVLDVVAQWTAGRVNIYLGVASGGFSTGPVLAASGWGGYQLTIGYWLSNSHFPQVLTRDDAGTLTFWRNSSGGGLGTASKIGTGWAKLNLTMVDFDGDGNQDILAQDAAGIMRQYRSNGSGSFIAESRRAVGSSWNQMTSVTVTFSFKGYAATGIMARTREGILRYYPVPGNSSWGAVTIIGSAWGSYLIAGGENINGQVPSAPPSPTPAASPSIKAASDVVSAYADGILYRRPTGAGALGSPVKIGAGFTGSASVHVVDWNGDGVQDLAVQTNAGVLSIRKGLSAGGFSVPTVLLSGLAGADLTFGPWLKSSKYPGLIVRRPDGVVAFYSNAAGSTLGAPATLGTTFARTDLTMLDADGDGSQDLTAVDNLGQMTLYRSNGSGTFINENRALLGVGWSVMNSISPARGFTGPGSTGLLARDTTGALSYYPLAKGALGTKKALAAGWNTILIAGSATIIRQQSLSTTSDVVRADAGKLWAYPANGTGGLGSPYPIGTGWSTAKTLHVLDWNKDGVPDVLAQWSAGALSVYFGAKSGGFTGPLTLASTGFAQTTFVTGRWVKASSYPGLVGYGSDGILYYWANVSGGALSAPAKIGVSWGGLKIVMTDFDGDANQDLLAVNSLGSMRLYRSNGQGGFISETRKTVGSSWQYFKQFSSTAGFAGAGSKGVMALSTNGQLSYYPIVAGSKWGTRTTAGTLPTSSAVVSMATSAY
ncbi:GH25 family lysozyme [Arthrobacter sp. NPDC058192]|uniref:GH25 family lysozyme n=1 Tax=Arthrobacter sp. NPDC058192 TaxID=3346372 RepID=UPI0036EDEA91